jgi:uncharacterized protein (TIGR01777 family)
MGTVKKILITGGSGLIGGRLTELLLLHGYQVVHLSRVAKQNGIRSFNWDLKHQKIESGAFDNVDVVVHLAGAGINDKRWTARRKKEILLSRTESTKLLRETLAKTEHQVKTFISGSAVGYYGFSDSVKPFIESDPSGNDFLAKVTCAWEDESTRLQDIGLRVVKIRTGVVLSNRGGALMAFARPIRLMAGAPLGSGDQYLSWIHIDDLCCLFIKAIEDETINGAFNGVGPYAVTNKEMTRAIARCLKKPIWLPNIPGFILKIVVGGVSEIILNGSVVSSQKIQDKGFVFRFNTLEAALEDLLK